MNPQLKRCTAVAMLAVVAVLVAAPAVEAGPKIKRKYKGPRREVHVVHEHHSYPRRVVHRHDGGVAPFLAGVVGGLILGQAVGQAHAAPARVVHVYHDPYCDTRYSSMGAYEDHLYRSRHPRVVRVIERDSGRCVSTQRWQDRQWRECGDDWRDDRRGGHRCGDQCGDRCSHRYDDRYDDDRYDDGYDDRYDDGDDDRDW